MHGAVGVGGCCCPVPEGHGPAESLQLLPAPGGDWQVTHQHTVGEIAQGLSWL